MNLEQELLTHILKEHLPGEAPDSLKPDDDLIGSGILDSLAMIKLVTYLEQHFGIVVGAEEMASLPVTEVSEAGRRSSQNEALAPRKNQ